MLPTTKAKGGSDLHPSLQHPAPWQKLLDNNLNGSYGDRAGTFIRRIGEVHRTTTYKERMLPWLSHLS